MTGIFWRIVIVCLLFFSSQGYLKAGTGVAFHLDKNVQVLGRGYTSPVIQFDAPMDRAVLSWNAITPGDSSITMLLRARSANGRWSNWFAMGVWGEHIESHSVKAAPTQFGDVDIDTLQLKNPATEFQYRIVLNPAKDGALPHVANVALTAKNKSTYHKDPSAPIRSARPLKIPAFSQYEEGRVHQNEDLGKRICSPTSDAMVLAFNGASGVTPFDVAAKVYDSTGAEHYGNWPFNTAVLYSMLYASKSGAAPASYVRWYESFDQMLDTVRHGQPVIVSIGFKEGELKGAFKPTPGHLVVVRGADSQYIYVNDPAAPSRRQVARRYKIDEFIKAWKGMAYVVEWGR